ncbi:unnamed protein product [Rhizoctonia solani]|uniref:DUF3533 domain-containing protein n=1 Tax=Rhizoctonia solani TaxID=456999 RepID=A0A8H3I0M1_9AGAM|nr:unnamed protein product [Rhizoctonia solani]
MTPEGSPKDSAIRRGWALYDVSVGADQNEKAVHSSGASVLSFSPGRNRKGKRESGSHESSGFPPLARTETIQPSRPRTSNAYLHQLFDPIVESLLWDYVREVLIIVMMLVVLMWGALPLYWGSLAPGLSHAPNFKAWVVDLDGGPLGAFVIESVMNSTKIGNRHLDWEVKPASQFSSAQDVANQVVEEKAWAAITINPGASSTLYIARAYGDYTYDQTKAVTLYIEQARSENAIGQLIAPIATDLLDKTLRNFNARDIAAYIRAIRAHPDAIETSLESPSALAGAWWKTVNLKPWDAAVAWPMTIVGQIYLTLFAFIITMSSHRARRNLEPHLTYNSLVALRIAIPLAAYIPISTSYAMLGLFFRAPFDAKYSGGGFFIYVAYTYLDICALGLACEAAMSILRPDHMPLFLVSWFYKDGYLILPGFIPKDETSALLARAKQLIAEFPLEGHPMTRFTTGEEDDPNHSKKHVGDEYFLTSGDKIRFFLEDDAFDAKGNLAKPKEKSVNKIGHGLHELDSVFRKFTMENEKLRQLARDLAFHQDPEGKLISLSMVICKQPEIGGKVPEHNDSSTISTFLYTDPPSALGFWFALEPCTEFNGALSFLPGSHRTTFVRLPEGGTGFVDIENPITPLDLQSQKLERTVDPKASEGDYILETCDAGTLVLIHGSVLHKSERNTSQNTRFAYTFHMIESAPKVRYDERNWLQPAASMPFSKLYGTQAVH